MFSFQELVRHYYNDSLKILFGNEVSQIINYYNPQDFNLIGYGGSASVYAANWKNTQTTYAIKKVVDDKEVYLTNMVNGHPNIIRLYGVTKLEDDEKYSLVLEYADSGTLRDFLRNSTITFQWKDQLKFAKEIASAISWLHSVKIIHGNLHPDNILIHQHTIKLADFGRSYLKGSDYHNSGVCGAIPYMDPKTFDRKSSYKINEKSDIYSLGVLFWELTSRSSPFNYETRSDPDIIKSGIFMGLREEPVRNTNATFVKLYQKCWKHEPGERPDILQVISEVNSMDLGKNNTTMLHEVDAGKKLNDNEVLSTLELLWDEYMFSINGKKGTPESRAKLLGEENVLPVKDPKTLQRLDDLSEDFWDEYGNHSEISSVSPGMISEEPVLVVLIDKSKYTVDNVLLPATFKGCRVFLEYGTFKSA